MSKLVLCSSLGLSGFLFALIAQGCSNSSSTPPAGGDSGTAVDSGTGTQADTGTGTSADTGTGTSADTGTGTSADTGTGTEADTGSQVIDAGPWTPSNFTTSAIANALTPTPPDVTVNGGECSANTDTGVIACNDGNIGGLEDGGTPTIPYVTVTLPNGGGQATLWAMSSFTIETSSGLDVTGSKPAIFYVLGNVEIDSPVTVEAGSQTAGPGAGSSPTTAGSYGAGGGGYCGAGGTGAPDNDSGTSTVGAGPSNGLANLIPLLAGYPGGTTNGAGGTMGQAGGGGVGGGAIQITALGSLVITGPGSILAAGAYGPNDGEGNVGGGGSGGAILLEAPSVSILGSLSVNGGAGSDNTGTGKSGNLGTSQAIPAGGGGQGSGGAVPTGGNATGGDNASGGGGAGYIRINSANASVSSATLSPDLGDAGGGCTTVGPLP